VVAVHDFICLGILEHVDRRLKPIPILDLDHEAVLIDVAHGPCLVGGVIRGFINGVASVPIPWTCSECGVVGIQHAVQKIRLVQESV
jgi:hypothetical protein